MRPEDHAIFDWTLSLCQPRSKPIPEEWGEVHWKALLTFCRAHGLGGWVANRLPEDTPSVVQLELTKLRDQARVRGMLLLRGARECREVLSAAGVEKVVPLKGIYLLSELYRIGVRIFNDIDLLIARGIEISAMRRCSNKDGVYSKPTGRPYSQKKLRAKLSGPEGFWWMFIRQWLLFPGLRWQRMNGSAAFPEGPLEVSMPGWMRRF